MHNTGASFNDIYTTGLICCSVAVDIVPWRELSIVGLPFRKIG